MGGYGFIRFRMPMFPDAVRRSSRRWSLRLSVVAAIITLAGRDDAGRHARSSIAYSSVAHMGFVTMGLCSMRRAYRVQCSRW